MQGQDCGGGTKETARGEQRRRTTATARSRWSGCGTCSSGGLRRGARAGLVQAHPDRERSKERHQGIAPEAFRRAHVGRARAARVGVQGQVRDQQVQKLVDRKLLCRAMAIEQPCRDSIICTQGEEGEAFYMIFAGTCSVYVRSKGSRQEGGGIGKHKKGELERDRGSTSTASAYSSSRVRAGRRDDERANSGGGGWSAHPRASAASRAIDLKQESFDDAPPPGSRRFSEGDVQPHQHVRCSRRVSRVPRGPSRGSSPTGFAALQRRSSSTGTRGTPEVVVVHPHAACDRHEWRGGRERAKASIMSGVSEGEHAERGEPDLPRPPPAAAVLASHAHAPRHPIRPTTEHICPPSSNPCWPVSSSTVSATSRCSSRNRARPPSWQTPTPSSSGSRGEPLAASPCAPKGPAPKGPAPMNCRVRPH